VTIAEIKLAKASPAKNLKAISPECIYLKGFNGKVDPAGCFISVVGQGEFRPKGKVFHKTETRRKGI
jgi:hypothetical protein